jgi:hypothetical protein
MMILLAAILTLSFPVAAADTAVSFSLLTLEDGVISMQFEAVNEQHSYVTDTYKVAIHDESVGGVRQRMFAVATGAINYLNATDTPFHGLYLGFFSEAGYGSVEYQGDKAEVMRVGCDFDAGVRIRVGKYGLIDAGWTVYMPLWNRMAVNGQRVPYFEEASACPKVLIGMSWL